jgi:hypothetical protein
MRTRPGGHPNGICGAGGGSSGAGVATAERGRGRPKKAAAADGPGGLRKSPPCARREASTELDQAIRNRMDIIRPHSFLLRSTLPSGVTSRSYCCPSTRISSA